jgi:hypothetical protein
MQPGDLVTVSFERSQGEEPPALGILMNRYTCTDLGPWWEVMIGGVVKVAHLGELTLLEPLSPQVGIHNI